MTSLPIMKEPLIPRVVGDVVAQCGVPSLASRDCAPFGVAAPNQARQDGRTPQRPRSQDIDCGWTALFHFGPDNRIERVVRFGHAVHPEHQCPPFDNFGHGRLEPTSIHVLHRSHRTGFLRAALSQGVRRRNLEFPLIECRPVGRRGSAPVSFRPLPQTPGLFDTQVLVGVIDEGVEPSFGVCSREAFRREPFLEDF
jgi:hypothetical protein